MGLRRDLVFGVLWGAALACTLTTLLLLAALVSAALRIVLGVSSPHALEELPLAALVLAYFVGGIAAGATLSMLWWRVEGAMQATFAGFFAAIPFVTAVRVALYGATGWSVGDLTGIYIRSLAVGSVAVLFLWSWSRSFTGTRRNR